MKKSSNQKSLCPICGGRKLAAHTTFTTDFGTGLLVVRQTPVSRCVQCGEEWVSNEVAQKLEKLVNKARTSKAQFQILTL